MEKITDPFMIDRLLTGKDWDFCILYMEGRNPIFIEKDVKIEQHKGQEFLLIMESKTGHPAPMSEEMAQRSYNMVSYFDKRKVYAIDFYTENRIQSLTPGTGSPVISMRN